MLVLVLVAVCVGALVLFRRRAGRAPANWRSLIGFACGAVLGFLLSGAVAGDAGHFVRATGMPWFAVRLVFACLCGLGAAKAVRELLEEAFPPGPAEGRGRDDRRQR